MYPYAIGLDIGVSSVGWAAVALDESEHPCGILDMGSRIFPSAEHPKNGASLALPRREARGARRRLRRHKHRNERIRNLLLSQGILTEAELTHLYDGVLSDIYALRVRALDEEVSAQEFARILIHISQRRGFRSNRKSGVSKEDGELLSAVNENLERIKENGYRTVAELFLKDEIYRENKRNKGGKYISTVSRDMVADEVRAIFKSQRGFGSSFASEEIEAAYLEILLSQRSFDEGPGGESPYGGNQIENMVGKCTLEPEEMRAAKATYSFEYFNLLERINHIRLVTNTASIPLTAEQRAAIVSLAHKSANLTYAKLRKELGISEEFSFNMVHYTAEMTPEDAEKKEKFCYLKAYHEMRVAFDKLSKGHIATLSTAQKNAIGRALSLYKTEEKICDALKDSGLTAEEIACAISIGSFSKFGHLSVKACDKLIPHLEAGMNYNDACAAAGYDFKGHSGKERSTRLHLTDEDLESVTSPVVRRAISQTVKVLNAIVRERGSAPTFINIELAREMAKDFGERTKLRRDMESNRARNERALERIKTEFGKRNPTGLDLVKLKLFEEQGGVCAYSQKQMSLERIFDTDYAEVDHIIPYSISFDDSYKNKVLVLSKENRDKGNRLPMQYLSGEARDRFIVWVNACVRDFKKRRNLLKERITEEDRNKFKERNLQDTKTMSRFLLNYINDRLEFAPSDKRKKRVTAVNGAITSYIRKRWGISKVRANGDLHHAVDAVVIACTTDRMIQEISRYAALRECEYLQTEEGSFAVNSATGEVLRRFPYPWEWFRKELEARLTDDPARVLNDLKIPLYREVGFPAPLFVSRMPQRKVTGAAHKETIKSAKALSEGLAVVKRPLTDLKLKDGEIENYYMPESDRLLYEALLSRLIAFGGDAKKAFAEEFRKPKADGSPGPIVRKVKLTEPTTLNVKVHDGLGIADNGGMVRIDVFHVENDGYYFIPIYTADTLKAELPNKACTRGYAYADWKEMKEEDFLFSLYPNDLIRVTSSRMLKLTKAQPESDLPDCYETESEFLYYTGADIATASISTYTHDGAYRSRGLGIKTLANFEKYTVDVLGRYHKVSKEPRQRFVRK